MNYKGFEDLECWKKGYSFKVFLRQEILKNFPADEKYLLTSQLIRAARSYNANIAEGWGRYHYKDNIKFLFNARGSIAECLDHLIEARSCNYINDENLSESRKRIDEILKILNGYIKFLREQSSKEKFDKAKT